MVARAKKRSGVEPPPERLTREKWLEEALNALAERGPSELTVQGLAKALGVSRGSFYWHFEDREEFLHAMLDYWHYEYTVPVPERVEAHGGSPEDRLLYLCHMVYMEGIGLFDPPIRAWALRDPEIAKAVRRTDRFRLRYIRQLFAEMGFSGDELEARSRLCFAYLATESSLFDKGTKRDRLKHLVEFHRFLSQQADTGEVRT